MYVGFERTCMIFFYYSVFCCFDFFILDLGKIFCILINKFLKVIVRKREKILYYMYFKMENYLFKYS